LQTAKRLRDRDDFGFDESVQYAVKKRRFLMSNKMDECFYGDTPAKENGEEYAEDEEEASEDEDPSDEEEESEDEEIEEKEQGED
jgi:hypothetical protein